MYGAINEVVRISLKLWFMNQGTISSFDRHAPPKILENDIATFWKHLQ